MQRILIIIIFIVLSVSEIYANELLSSGKMHYSRGDFTKAVNSFEQFVRSHPDSAEGFEWLGKAYYSLGDNEFSSDPQTLEKAAYAFRKSLSLDPQNQAIHFDLGMTFLNLEEKSDALKEYELLKKRDKELANRLLERINSHSFPPVYRSAHVIESPVTHVKILGNAVLVPVTLSRDGNEVQATLLLDTGASITSIHSDVAARLRIDGAQTQKTMGLVAGGGVLEARRTKLSYVSVGPYTKSGLDVAIMEHKGPAVPYEGLLGMNFLRGLRYVIDFQNQTINWNP